MGEPSIEAKSQYPLAPSQLDAKNYRDPDQFERELERVFFNSWLPAFPSSDLPKRRDYVVWDRLRESVVIARQDDDSLVAWHNVCQHRGARLLAESGHGQIGKIVCPWHGFTYDLGGRVAGVPLRESFDPREIKNFRAPAVRVTEWSGFVWLYFSENALANTRPGSV
jgi:choline monooxygenase